jgi:hypothetical protein
MAAKKFLRTGTGNEVFDEVAGIQVSAGAGNAGDIVSLDDAGKLDVSLMPTGIGADTIAVLTSEALADGDLVNLWNNAGTLNVRKADATTTGKSADGYVMAGFSSGVSATVYCDGTNSHCTGMTPGKQWLSTTPGKTSATRPTASGNVQQMVGTAKDATTLTFESGDATIKVA